MKKFLAFLLIAIVACEVVDDIDLEGFLGGLWDKLTGAAKKAYEWLKSHGVLDQIKNALKAAGKAAAIAICSAYLDPAICSAVIGVL